MFTGDFQHQVVAWYLHLHEDEVVTDIVYPPGTAIAPDFEPLSRDGRFPVLARTHRWVVGSTC